MRVRNGFTLIELLVVIAIIGILSSVVLSALNDARKRGNDARRLSDIHAVQNALELYRDARGYYPAYVGADNRESSCFSGGAASDAVGQWGSALSVLVTDKYLSRLPIDPQNTGVVGGAGSPDFCYTYHIAPMGNVSAYDACRDRITGEMLYPGDYEYLIYHSVENISTSRYVLYWNGNAVVPANACAPGPHR